MDRTTWPSAFATNHTERKQPLPVVCGPPEQIIHSEDASPRCQNAEDSVSCAALGPIPRPPESPSTRSRGKRRPAYIHLLHSPRRFVSMLLRTFRPQFTASCFSRRPPDDTSPSTESAARMIKGEPVPIRTKGNTFKMESSSPAVVKPNRLQETKAASHTLPKSVTGEPPQHSFPQDSAQLCNSEQSPVAAAGLSSMVPQPEELLCHVRLSPALCAAEKRIETRSVPRFAQRHVRLKPRHAADRNGFISSGSVQHKRDVHTPTSKGRQIETSAANKVEKQPCSAPSRLTSQTVHETVHGVCHYCPFPTNTGEPDAYDVHKEASDSCREVPCASENAAICSPPIQNLYRLRRFMVGPDSHAHAMLEQPIFHFSTDAAATASKNELERKHPVTASVSDQHRSEMIASAESFKTATSLTTPDGCRRSVELPVSGGLESLDTKVRSAGKTGAPHCAKRKTRDGVQLKIVSARKGSSGRWWCSSTRASCGFAMPQIPAGINTSLEVTEKGKCLSLHLPQSHEHEPGTARQLTGAYARVERDSEISRNQRHKSDQADQGISGSQSFVTACSDRADPLEQLHRSCSLPYRPFWQKACSAAHEGSDQEDASKVAGDNWRFMPTTAAEPGLPFRPTYIGAKRKQATNRIEQLHHIEPATSRNPSAYMVPPVIDRNAGNPMTPAEGTAEAVWRGERESSILCQGSIGRDSGFAGCVRLTGEPYLLPCQKWEIPGSGSGTERMKVKRRKQLPCAKSNTGNLSLKKILLQVSSSDMWNFSLPIGVNEPLSLLQRLCEDFEYPELLSTARSCSSPTERLAFVTSFALSAYASSADRCYKPFNPMLGETFELSHRGINFIGEQVSHHPPVSAYHAAAHNRSFVCFGTVAPRLSIAGTHVESSNCGAVYLRLFLPNGQHEDYTWSRANTKVHNVFFGAMWMEWTGEITVTNLTTGDNAQVSFLPSVGVHSPSQGAGIPQPALGTSAASWLPSFRLLGVPAAHPTPSTCMTKAANSYGNSVVAGVSQSSCMVFDLEENIRIRTGSNTPPASNSSLTKTFDGKATKEIREPCAPCNTAADSSPLLLDKGLTNECTRDPCPMVQSALPSTALQQNGRPQHASQVPTSASIWKTSSVVRRRESGHQRRASWLPREDRHGCTVRGVVRDTSGCPRFFLDGSWNHQLWLTKIGRRSLFAANPDATVDTQENMLKKSQAKKDVACVASSAQDAPSETKRTAKRSVVLSTVPCAPGTEDGCNGPDAEDGGDGPDARDVSGERAPQGVSELANSRGSGGHDEDEQWCDDDLLALIWEATPKPEYAGQFYNMTSFAMELNELTADYYPANWARPGSGGVAPTDSRLRPDLRKYEDGAVTAAQEEKNRLEAKQRQESRRREAKGEKWAPRWFSKGRNSLTGEEDWVYNGLYWRERVCGEVVRCAYGVGLKSARSPSAGDAAGRFEMCPSLF